ncbi:hypothetical protein BU23DRAFT_577671 [Bimuria novae-zelandiae CBS 107.79]|uniref:Uncharacterized protein n=1 Tax=Bimuria novae-zelandiae CBS 107.79 TaxID=1447943 RepID=A0A6A5VM05_9PLEO|nr:hypothetical protein BU23DRAFT_577671 [Bimuria novae-zelandiae CBS 107.79]
MNRGNSFSNAYTVIKNHFNHDTTITFARTRIENPNKSLYKNFKGKDTLLLELKIALFKLAIIFKTHLYYLNRRYNNRNRRTRRGFRGKGRFLTNHTNKKRKAARTQFFSVCYFIGTLLPTDFSMHLAEYKGTFIHYISSKDIYSRDVPLSPASQFLIKDRYTRSKDPTVTIDTSTAGKTSIKFGKGSVTVSISTAQILIEIKKIDFKVLDAPTPFLLYLADMDRLKGNVRIPVIYK